MNFNEVGINNVFVRITDLGGMYTDVPMQVEVLNDAPYFMYYPLPDLDIPMNTSTKLNFTFNVYDFEGHQILL